VRNNLLYYVHNDHLGRPELVSNAARGTVWSAKNYAFDRTVSLDQIGGLNLGFPGQYFDSETGTWYNLFRDYDSSIGRYPQSDPIGLGGGLNSYGYAGGNPLSYVDPTGTNLLLIAGCAMSAWGGYSASKTYADLNRSSGVRGGSKPSKNSGCPDSNPASEVQDQVQQQKGQMDRVTNTIPAYGAPALKAIFGVVLTTAGGEYAGAALGVACTTLGAKIGYERYKP
jgi:RHS repeat-associated protein